MATVVTKWTDVNRPLTFSEVDENWESIRQAIDVVVETHRIATDNPHTVTALQVGAPDQASFDTHTGQTNPHGLAAGDIGALDSAHLGASNPHNINPTLIGAASLSDVIAYDWKGTYASAAELQIIHGAPQTGWAYRNTTTPATYYYQGGAWQVMNLDGTSIFYLGEYAAPPPGPNYNEVYKNTTDGILYIWNGASWEVMLSDGSDGVNGSQGLDGYSVYITYHDNLSDNEPAPPTAGSNGNTGGWHTNPTNLSVWMSQKVAASETAGTWGDPILVRGEDGVDGDIGEQGYYIELDAAEGIFFINQAQETGGAAGAGNPVTYAYTPSSITINLTTNDTNEIWSSSGLTIPLSGTGSQRIIAVGDLSGDSATITVVTDNMSKSITLTKQDDTTGTYIGSDGVFTGYLSAIQINAGKIDTDRLEVNKALVIDAAGTIGSSNFSAGSAGWQIDGDGDAEFNNVVIRGEVALTRGIGANVTPKAYSTFNNYADTTSVGYADAAGTSQVQSTVAGVTGAKSLHWDLGASTETWWTASGAADYPIDITTNNSLGWIVSMWVNIPIANNVSVVYISVQEDGQAADNGSIINIGDDRKGEWVRISRHFTPVGAPPYDFRVGLRQQTASDTNEYYIDGVMVEAAQYSGQTVPSAFVVPESTAIPYDSLFAGEALFRSRLEVDAAGKFVYNKTSYTDDTPGLWLDLGGSSDELAFYLGNTESYIKMFDTGGADGLESIFVLKRDGIPLTVEAIGVSDNTAAQFTGNGGTTGVVHAAVTGAGSGAYAFTSSGAGGAGMYYNGAWSGINSYSSGVPAGFFSGYGGAVILVPENWGSGSLPDASLSTEGTILLDNNANPTLVYINLQNGSGANQWFNLTGTFV